MSEVTWEVLSKINESQSTDTNKVHLDSAEIGGINGLAKKLVVNFETGLSTQQVEAHLKLYENNSMPASKSKTYLELLIAALSDTTLLVLTAAAAVSFGLGYWQSPEHGWIEGAAIFIAVFLVSNIAAFNDYSKELQFRALEASSNQDERTSVLRNGKIELINPCDLVVGDILVMQVGYVEPTCTYTHVLVVVLATHAFKHTCNCTCTCTCVSIVFIIYTCCVDVNCRNCRHTHLTTYITHHQTSLTTHLSFSTSLTSSALPIDSTPPHTC